MREGATLKSRKRGVAQGHLILMMLDWNELESGRHLKPLISLSPTEITEEMGWSSGLTP
jgi:hypothetical protein